MFLEGKLKFTTSTVVALELRHGFNSFNMYCAYNFVYKFDHTIRKYDELWKRS